MSADPAIPAAKVERVSQAIFCEQMNRGPECTTHHLAEAAIRAVAGWDAEQGGDDLTIAYMMGFERAKDLAASEKRAAEERRAAAGPRPVRERDTDAWWAD